MIFITGGVISSLGKGVITASIISILEEIGFKVTALKLDPYLNVDAGTMNPFEHGEVFVTFDGGETDLDIGHYERFSSLLFPKENNITSGKIYLNVIEKERKGEFLGQTIQVIPHVTNEIKEQIYSKTKNFDIGIIETGGTVGDIESLPFLEAARQTKIEFPNTLFIHVSYVPYIPNTNELKTKPTQHSVKQLTSLGIQPNFIILRIPQTHHKISNLKQIREKIALFSNLNPSNIIDIPNFKYIYQIPLYLLKNKFHKKLLSKLKIKKADLRKISKTIHKDSRWAKINEILINLKKLQKVKVSIVGKYTKLKDSYKSLSEALLHSAIKNNLNLEINWVDSENIKDFDYKKTQGIIIPGGFGERGTEGKIEIIKIARENNFPILGICLGLQLMFIEFARNVLGLKQANSTEFDSKTQYPVIDIMESQKMVKYKGGTMRLGAYLCKIDKGTLAEKVYQTTKIYERHRHR
ncbi:MAG: CTP synthase, partial [bacterium]